MQHSGRLKQELPLVLGKLETLFPKIRTEKGHGRILLQVKNRGLERPRDLDFSEVHLSVVSKPEEVSEVNREFKQAHRPGSRLCCVSLYLALFFFIIAVIYVYGCFDYLYVSPPHECLMPKETRRGCWIPKLEFWWL